MSRLIKLAIASVVAVLAVIIGFRELTRTSALPTNPHGHEDGVEPKPAGKKDEHGHDHAHGHAEQGEGFVKLSSEQIEAAGIEMAPAVSGTLVKEIAVPGRISINADRQAKIVPKLSGTVARINKLLGEEVAANEVLAVLESRDMADGKAEYLAAWRTEELAETTREREERLWKKKVTAKQDYLNARNAHQLAEIKLDLARQRLLTMGLTANEIAAIPTISDESKMRFYEIRSPISGRVAARNLQLGQFVGTEKEVFTIADLTTVWVEMAIAPSDLGFAKEGQEVLVQSGGRRTSGKVVALSPVIDPHTRSAKAIAEIDNRSGEWKLGDFVTAKLIAGQQEVSLRVPREAIQTIKGVKAVFVSQGGGFKMRPVTTGREDSANIEIVSGLEFAEIIATRNTFVLKADHGKAEAKHQH